MFFFFVIQDELRRSMLNITFNEEGNDEDVERLAAAAEDFLKNPNMAQEVTTSSTTTSPNEPLVADGFEVRKILNLNIRRKIFLSPFTP